MAGSEARSGIAGHRHGSRTRSLTGTFGPIEIAVPRARLNTPEGGTTEWKSHALRAYQRRTLAADALIASTYLAGTNTRRVRRALAALFGGTVGKDTVSRTWRKVKSDWDAWSTRSLAGEPIVRLILDGCESAWGPDADRHAKLLIIREAEGSLLEAYLQSPSTRPRSGRRTYQPTWPKSCATAATSRRRLGHKCDRRSTT